MYHRVRKWKIATGGINFLNSIFHQFESRSSAVAVSAAAGGSLIDKLLKIIEILKTKFRMLS